MMGEPLKAVIFDLDGTLIDSAPDIHAVTNGLLQQDGLAPLSLDEVRGFIGRGLPHLIDRIIAARPDVDATGDERHTLLLDRFAAAYEAAVDLTRTYPGVADALQALKDCGLGLGLCTNKPMRPCEAILRHLGLLERFDVIIAGDSQPERKPHPAPLRAALGRLGVRPEEAVLVGDSDIDAETAAACGVRFVFHVEGCCNGTLPEPAPVIRFSSFSQLPGLLRELRHRDAAE